MNKKVYLLLALVVLVAVALVGCGTTQPAADTKAPAQTAAAPAKGLVEQVKETGHFNYFKWQVSKGPDGNKAGHYSDACISCHSAVKMIDDPNAKLADFYPGGKYAGQTEGIDCRVCHELKGPGGIQLKKQGWDTCASCHTSGAKPVIGNEVHHPQGEMVKGVGVGEVPDTPSYKYANIKDFSCQSCHITNSTKHDFMVPGVTTKHDEKDPVTRVSDSIDYTKFATVFQQQKCQTCHSDATKTVDMVKKQQTEVKAQLEALKPVYDEWTKKVATMDKNDPKVKAFKDGSTYYTYVEADGSYGVHNPDFTKALLAKAKEKYDTLK